MAPKSIGWSLRIRNIFMPAFEKATDGKVSIKWYWGGLKGDDNDYIRLMNDGKLDGAALAGHGVTIACPEMSALGLPFLFRNFDEVDYVRKQMLEKFSLLAEQHGYKLLFWGDQDFDQIYTIQDPIQTVNDFKNVTFAGFYDTPIELLLIQRLGTKHLPLKTLDISSTIRQRKANAYIGPALWVVGCQLYTLFRYITPLKIRYSPAALIMTQKAWHKIPKKYQSKINQALNENGRLFCEKARIDTSRALVAMEKYGLKLIQVSPETQTAMKTLCKPIWYETADKSFPQSILDDVQEHIQAVRNHQQSTASSHQK